MKQQLKIQPEQKEQLQKPSSSSPLQATSAVQATTHPLLRLQRAVGNQAVQRMIRSSQNDRQAQHSSPNVKSTAAIPTSVHNVLSSSGQPLAPATRFFMESRFGHDFSKVRIHEDEGAAHNINATAYTMGQDIVFDSGQYRPETNTGKRLLAHELAHVVQQSRGGTITPPPLPNHPLEQAAQDAASTIVQGGTAYVAGASAPGIARQPRSLNESLDPTSMSDADLQQEIALIRQWLDDNPASSPERNQLMSALLAMEAEVMRRNGQQNQTPVDQGQNQAGTDTGAVPAIAAAGILTTGVPSLAPTTPPPGPIPEGALNNWPRIPGETPFQAPTTAPELAPELAPEVIEVGVGVTEVAAAGTAETITFLGLTLTPVGWVILAVGAVVLVGVGIYAGRRYLLKEDRTPARPLTPEEDLQAKANEGKSPADFPGLEEQYPAIDPVTGEKLYTPANQDQAPAIDPVTGEPIQLPGNQSGESMETAGDEHILPPVTTPAGRKLSEHALESLPRHQQMTPEQVDNVIDNPSRTRTQDDGAKVYIKKESGRGRNYSIVIEGTDGVIVTGMQNLTPAELEALGKNNGFNPNP